MATVIPLYRTGDAAWVDLKDNATPYLKYLAGTFPKEMQRALKSLGWYLREEIKAGLASGSPGGRNLAPLSAIQSVRFIDAIKKRKKWKRKPKWSKDAYRPVRPLAGATAQPYGRKLPRAVRYHYDDSAMSVHIGWVTPTASSYGRMGAVGMRGRKLQWKNGPQTVTSRMRKLFAAAGIFLKEGSTIRTPARPVVGPVYDQKRGEIPAYLEKKVSKWLARSLDRSVTYAAGRAVMGNSPLFNYLARNAA